VGKEGAYTSQALETKQHTWQQINILLLSRNLNENIHKNALFLEKALKSPQRWGLASNSRWSPAAGALPLQTKYFCEFICTVTFYTRTILVLTRFIFALKEQNALNFHN